jgi:hypothetical protein
MEERTIIAAAKHKVVSDGILRLARVDRADTVTFFEIRRILATDPHGFAQINLRTHPCKSV